MGGEEGVIVVFIRVLLAAHEQHVLQVVAQALQRQGESRQTGEGGWMGAQRGKGWGHVQFGKQGCNLTRSLSLAGYFLFKYKYVQGQVCAISSL